MSITPLQIGLLFSDERFDLQLIAEQLAPHHIHALQQWNDWDSEELCEKIRACDVVVTGRSSPALPDALLADRGRLRLLAHCFGTVKHLVSKELLLQGLEVVNWGDQVAGVAEGAMALLLACLKQLSALDAFIRADWSNDQRIERSYPATLAGRDVGLYGFGPIARHMNRMLSGFGAQVAVYDPYAKDVPRDIRICSSLQELFSTCQCISIHCGLNEGTQASVNRQLLELLPQGGILINTARGAIVVEEDLAEAVAAGRIIAAVDVICDERAWPRSPLAALPSQRMLLTGHILSGGGKTSEEKKAKVGLPPHTVANIHALGSGAPLRYVITAEEYDLKT